MRKSILWTVFLVLGLTAGIFLFKAFNHMVLTDPKKARWVNAAMPVETALAQSISLEEVIGASGEVQQIATVSLTANVDSRVLEIPVDLGSIVQNGDLLIRWEDRLLRAALESSNKRLQKSDILLRHTIHQLDRLATLEAEGLGSLVEVEEAEIQVAEAREEQATAKAELIQAEIKLEYTELRSPVGGVVLGRMVNPGETTSADQFLITIGELDHILMVAYVGEEKIGSVHLGQKAEVSYDAYPGEPFTGEIVKIDPKTDLETRSFKAFIKISNPGLRLKPGLSGFSRIHRQKNTLAIPSTALINPVVERSTVFIVGPDGRAHLREVRVGLIAKGMTEILEGLKEGDEVVTVGQMHLKENDSVHTKGSRHAEE